METREYVVPDDVDFGFSDQAKAHEAYFAILDAEIKDVYCYKHSVRARTDYSADNQLVVIYCCEEMLPWVERAVRRGKSV